MPCRWPMTTATFSPWGVSSIPIVTRPRYTSGGSKSGASRGLPEHNPGEDLLTDSRDSERDLCPRAIDTVDVGFPCAAQGRFQCPEHDLGAFFEALLPVPI